MFDLLFSAAILLGFMCPGFHFVATVGGLEPHRGKGGGGWGLEGVLGPSFVDGRSFVHVFFFFSFSFFFSFFFSLLFMPAYNVSYLFFMSENCRFCQLLFLNSWRYTVIVTLAHR